MSTEKQHNSAEQTAEERADAAQPVEAKLPQDFTLFERLNPMIGLAEQTVLALIVGLSLCVIAGYYYSVHFTPARWIDVDEATRRSCEFRLDINQAEWPELSMLPGVGESLARRIVDDRNTNGPFENVDQVMRVHGIGEKKVAAFREYVFPVELPESANKRRPDNKRPGPDAASRD